MILKCVVEEDCVADDEGVASDGDEVVSARHGKARESAWATKPPLLYDSAAAMAFGGSRLSLFDLVCTI